MINTVHSHDETHETHRMYCATSIHGFGIQSKRKIQPKKENQLSKQQNTLFSYSIIEMCVMCFETTNRIVMLKMFTVTKVLRVELVGISGPTVKILDLFRYPTT